MGAELFVIQTGLGGAAEMARLMYSGCKAIIATEIGATTVVLYADNSAAIKAIFDARPTNGPKWRRRGRERRTSARQGLMPFAGLGCQCRRNGEGSGRRPRKAAIMRLQPGPPPSLIPTRWFEETRGNRERFGRLVQLRTGQGNWRIFQTFQHR